MLKKIIKGTEYEIVIEFEDNGQGNAIARTIVEEGETPVNKYRIRVSSANPLTQIPFNGNINLLNDFVMSVKENTWDTYWEDEEE